MNSPVLINGYIVINILFSVAIAWICVCRVALMARETTRTSFRLLYALMIVAAVASGSSPWLFSEAPGPGAALMSAALLAQLCSSFRVWRDGVPPPARTQPGELTGGST